VPLPPSPIGFDASVLINFCAVRRLDLLVTTCDPPRYVLTDVLEEELEPGCRTQVDELIARGEFASASLETDEELRQWARYTLRLDHGESATLAAAMERGWSVAVDERAGRRIAEGDLGAERLTGTVGILTSAVERAQITIDEGDRLLAEMIDAGYWSPVASLREARRNE
jgi:predicted nucleic acid-binding protein